MRKRTTTLGLLAWLALAGLGPATAQAAPARRSGRSTNRRPPSDKGPAETRAERDRRLQRECKGKPSAGACEGYGG